MLQLFWLLPLATLFQEMSALKKGKKRERIRGNKKGQVPGTSKKRKSETKSKNGQVSDSRIRGTRYPPERKEKENIEHLILLKIVSKEQERYVSP